MLAERPHVVLVHTHDAINLGAAARAMKNFGLSRLTLVAPRDLDLVTARRIAVHADDLLAAPRVVPTLAEAVAEAVWVVGTTSRRLPGRPPLSPAEVASEAALRAAAGPVALVFGGEESGLSNADLLACHAISTIAASAEQPSLNLAQSVLLYGHALFAAAGGAEPAPVADFATDAELGHIELALRELLEAASFPGLDRPRHGVRDLAQTLRRAGLTPGESRLWSAALRGVLQVFQGRGPR